MRLELGCFFRFGLNLRLLLLEDLLESGEGSLCNWWCGLYCSLGFRSRFLLFLFCSRFWLVCRFRLYFGRGWFLVDFGFLLGRHNESF